MPVPPISHSEEGNALVIQKAGGQLVLRDAELGPDMLALNSRQRAFVFHLVEQGGSNYERAAALAGYTGSNETLRVQGSRLAHDERVSRAMLEEARRRIHATALLAASELHKVLADPATKSGQRITAAVAVLNRAGMGPSQTHIVERRGPDQAEQIKNITEMARKLGIDPATFLGTFGVTLEGEPVVDLTPEERLRVTADTEFAEAGDKWLERQKVKDEIPEEEW